MNNEMERIWKEAIFASFEVLYRYLPGELRKTTKNLSQDSRSPGRDLKPGHPKYEVGVIMM